MRKEETEKKDFEKNMQTAWELHCLQFIYQWFDGVPIEENYKALSELILGIT